MAIATEFGANHSTYGWYGHCQSDSTPGL